MSFHETCFAIPKMDCPSEEQVIRMALDSATGIENLSFDLGARTLTIVHTEAPNDLLQCLSPLGYGATIKTSRQIESLDGIGNPEKQKDEAKVLWILCFLNASMFLLETTLGVYSQSTGLIADGLDMLADASVYGISLYAVGKTVAHKHRAARLSGYFQLILAVGLFVEVVRRSVYGSEPMGGVMSTVSVAALFVNIFCLVLLNKHRGGEVHMKASWIFSANDVIANAGVILAGILVMLTGSRFPDLVIGTLISLVVLSGAIRILKMARN
ncbi:MAG: cation transporter [Oligoflexus sp.]